MEWMRLEDLHFGPDGLVPVVVQDASSGEVLMLAFANPEALARTLAEGRAWFFSRSRGRLWRKGETSGHSQEVVEVRCDCDGDAVLYRVLPRGPACHTGQNSCFHRFVSAPAGRVPVAAARPPQDTETPPPAGPAPPPPAGPAAPAPAGTALVGARPGPEILTELGGLLAQRRRERPAGSYTASLFAAGGERMARKVGEEAVEVVVASLRGTRDELVAEAADLVFHLLVLLVGAGVDPGEVWAELGRRRRF